MEERIKTLDNAITAMQEKIKQQMPVFRDAPLAQQVTVGTSEEILRQNPEISEFRALVKDYSQAIKAYKELTAGSGEADAEVQSLEAMRSRLKVAK